MPSAAIVRPSPETIAAVPALGMSIAAVTAVVGAVLGAVVGAVLGAVVGAVVGAVLGAVLGVVVVVTCADAPEDRPTTATAATAVMITVNLRLLFIDIKKSLQFGNGVTNISVGTIPLRRYAGGIEYRKIPSLTQLEPAIYLRKDQWKVGWFHHLSLW